MSQSPNMSRQGSAVADGIPAAVTPPQDAVCDEYRVDIGVPRNAKADMCVDALASPGSGADAEPAVAGTLGLERLSLQPVPVTFRLPSAKITRFLTQLMDSAVDKPAAVGCHFVDVFTLKNTPNVALGAFIDRVMTYANCDDSCFVVACVFVERVLAESEPHIHDADFAHGGDSLGCPHTGASMHLTTFNVHRLFAAAITLAIKSTQDVYHPMTYYGAVFGLSALDVRRLERALMVLMQHRLFVRLHDATTMYTRLCALQE